mmetsp:Transcript_40591/g.75566  ORF Transcript_40591/g.75566 Transcript_40591/m.75566 type:complete len:145 (-) Transcript_40591:15-449(-)
MASRQVGGQDFIFKNLALIVVFGSLSFLYTSQKEAMLSPAAPKAQTGLATKSPTTRSSDAAFLPQIEASLQEQGDGPGAPPGRASQRSQPHEGQASWGAPQVEAIRNSSEGHRQADEQPSQIKEAPPTSIEEDDEPPIEIDAAT